MVSVDCKREMQAEVPDIVDGKDAALKQLTLETDVHLVGTGRLVLRVVRGITSRRSQSQRVTHEVTIRCRARCCSCGGVRRLQVGNSLSRNAERLETDLSRQIQAVNRGYVV